MTKDEQIFALQELWAEHERVIARTARTSDVDKTMEHLRQAIKALVDEVS